MKMLLVCFISFFAMATSAPAVKWIDLTYPLHNATIHYGTFRGHKAWGFRLIPGSRIQDKDFYVEFNNIITMEHIGTHMDAPAHFHKGGKYIADIPLDQIIGPAVVVNMTDKATKNPDVRIMKSDLEAWEQEHGRIPDKSLFFLNFGWSKYWGDIAKYVGGDGKNFSSHHYPGIHVDAARWLLEERKIKMYGCDVISIDYGGTKTFPVHTYLSGKGVPAIENVANLNKLPPTGALVFAAPLKVRGASGMGVRLFATIGTIQTQSSAGIMAGSQVAFGTLLATFLVAILETSAFA